MDPSPVIDGVMPVRPGLGVNEGGIVTFEGCKGGFLRTFDEVEETRFWWAHG